MPYDPSKPNPLTRKADTPRRRRQWNHVYASIMKRTGDESRAIAGASSVAKKDKKKWARKKTAGLARRFRIESSMARKIVGAAKAGVKGPVAMASKIPSGLRHAGEAASAKVERRVAKVKGSTISYLNYADSRGVTHDKERAHGMLMGVQAALQKKADVASREYMRPRLKGIEEFPARHAAKGGSRVVAGAKRLGSELLGAARQTKPFLIGAGLGAAAGGIYGYRKGHAKGLNEVTFDWDSSKSAGFRDEATYLTSKDEGSMVCYPEAPHRTGILRELDSNVAHVDWRDGVRRAPIEDGDKVLVLRSKVAGFQGAILERGQGVDINDPERMMVQLGGVLAAADGATNEPHVVERGQYGWSPAYEAVLNLRRKYDATEEAKAESKAYVERFTKGATGDLVESPENRAAWAAKRKKAKCASVFVTDRATVQAAAKDGAIDKSIKGIPRRAATRGAIVGGVLGAANGVAATGFGGAHWSTGLTHGAAGAAVGGGVGYLVGRHQRKRVQHEWNTLKRVAGEGSDKTAGEHAGLLGQLEDQAKREWENGGRQHFVEMGRRNYEALRAFASREGSEKTAANTRQKRFAKKAKPITLETVRQVQSALAQDAAENGPRHAGARNPVRRRYDRAQRLSAGVPGGPYTRFAEAMRKRNGGAPAGPRAPGAHA